MTPAGGRGRARLTHRGAGTLSYLRYSAASTPYYSPPTHAHYVNDTGNPLNKANQHHLPSFPCPSRCLGSLLVACCACPARPCLACDALPPSTSAAPAHLQHTSADNTKTSTGQALCWPCSRPRSRVRQGPGWGPARGAIHDKGCPPPPHPSQRCSRAGPLVTQIRAAPDDKHSHPPSSAPRQQIQTWLLCCWPCLLRSSSSRHNTGARRVIRNFTRTVGWRCAQHVSPAAQINAN